MARNYLPNKKLKTHELILDPSIEFEEELEELIKRFKIKVISYSDNIEILTNIYYVMKIYLSDAVIDEVIKSCLDKSLELNLISGIRNKKIKELGL
jgi:hypothetical protein